MSTTCTLLVGWKHKFKKMHKKNGWVRFKDLTSYTRTKGLQPEAISLDPQKIVFRKP
jgi:hypothetical protein